MTELEAIIRELESLPTEKQKQAGQFIRQLRESERKKRTSSLKAIARTMSPQEVDEFERIIEEGCEQVNPYGWKSSD
jgi:hypothetical protein